MNKTNLIYRLSIISLKLLMVILVLLVLAFCVIVLPRGISAELAGDFDYGILMVILYVMTPPFLYATYQYFLLLTEAEHRTVFSMRAITLIRRIKLAIAIVAGLGILALPYVFYLADMDDAPGVVAFWLIITVLSAVATVTSHVLQHIMQVQFAQKNK